MRKDEQGLSEEKQGIRNKKKEEVQNDQKEIKKKENKKKGVTDKGRGNPGRKRKRKDEQGIRNERGKQE